MVSIPFHSIPFHSIPFINRITYVEVISTLGRKPVTSVFIHGDV